MYLFYSNMHNKEEVTDVNMPALALGVAANYQVRFT